MLTGNRKIDITLVINHLAYGLMAVVVIIDSYNAGDIFLTVLALQLVPLLMLLPGIISRHYRTYSWLCFLMLIYFTSYVVQVYSTKRDPLDWLGLVLTIILFVSAMLSSRWLQRLQKA